MKCSWLIAAGMLFCLSLTAGCATGNSFTQEKATIPAIGPTASRIYFYRTPSPRGSVIQTSILVDGKKVGSMQAGAVFFVDTTPGKHGVECDNNPATVNVKAHSACYVMVLCYSDGGIFYRFRPVLVEQEQGESDITDKVYVAKP